MLLALALSMALASCVRSPGGPAVGPLPGAPVVEQRLQARRLAVKSFIMSGQVEVVASQGELHGDHVILGAFPDRLRAEVVGPFGQPLLRVVTDGARLTVLAFRENRAYQGPASRANLARFLGLALSPAEVYAVLAGGPPLLPAEAKASVMPTSLDGQAMLKLVDPGGRVAQELIFALSDYAVQRAWLQEASGRWGLELEYGQMQPALASRYPRYVKVVDQEGRLLVLDNDQVELNSRLDLALFRGEVPAGMEVHRLP